MLVCTKAKSPINHELLFDSLVKQEGLPKPLREYEFHDTRKWRFDFAWPECKVAVEIEGGIYSGGRHTRGQGYLNDCIKYNAAVVDGWKLLRYPTNLVEDEPGECIDQLKEILNIK